MPLTDIQRAKRREGLGASDMMAVFGYDKYKTAYDLWLEKTDQLIDQPVLSEPMELGNALEEPILCWAEETLGPINRNVRAKAANGILVSNCDGIVKASGEPVEVKTNGFFGKADEAWGADGTDEIPEKHLVQTHTQLICVNDNRPAVDKCHVPVWIKGRGKVMFCVTRNFKLMDHIKRASETFWDCVITRKPPADSVPSLDYAKKILAVPEKTIELSRDVFMEYVACRAAAKKEKDAQDAAAAVLRAALRDAEIGTYEGKVVITCKMQSRSKKIYPPGTTYSTTYTTSRSLLVKEKGLPNA